MHDNSQYQRGRSQIVLVSGARSQIGPFLIKKLLDEGYVVHAVSREQEPQLSHELLKSPDIFWHQLTTERTLKSLVDIIQPHIWISVGPLYQLSESLKQIKSSFLKRVIGVSSTGVITKSQSGSRKEKESILKLLASEDDVRQISLNSGINFTLFRPTLVYSDGRDKNIKVIRNFIRKFRFFPILGSGSGLRQPVHAEDIATAIMACLEGEKSFNKTYILSGENKLTFRQMVEEVFKSEGMRPVILSLPLAPIVFGIRLMSLIPKFKYLNPEMGKRMQQNLDFDHHEATLDLNFRPRKFNSKNISSCVDC